MKNTKSKLAAATFGAALTTLYAAPELSAQIVDTNPTSTPLTFTTTGGMPFDGVVPFVAGGTSVSSGAIIQVQADSAAFSSAGAVGFTFSNNSFYGFNVNIQFLSQLFVLEPCSLFDGVPAGPVGFESEDPRILPLNATFAATEIFGTGVNTFGFVANGEIGYFRVDLGSVMGADFPDNVPLDDAMILDGATSLPTDGGENDFVVKTPGEDMTMPPVLKGDVNQDGVVNLGDITPFINIVLGGGTPVPEADVNCDGNINLGDIGAFIDILFPPVVLTDSDGETVDLAAVGNEDLARRVKQQLTEEVTAAVAVRQNSSSDQAGHASVGLAALAMGAVGLRRRRKAATTAA